MEHNQRSIVTAYNRYPECFKTLSLLIKNPKNILSFGCSTGSETNTLSDIYFKQSNIFGLDISKDVIKKNIENNKNNKIMYYDHINKLQSNIKQFDLICAMSVLCVWPEERGEYSFETFSRTLELIDSLLKKEGYLCIYNSKYVFTDTEVFKKYKVINTDCKETGFVYKYDKYGKKINNYPYFLFQKLED